MLIKPKYPRKRFALSGVKMSSRKARRDYPGPPCMLSWAKNFRTLIPMSAFSEHQNFTAFCRGADCTQRGGGSPLETYQFFNREEAYWYRAGKTYRPERASCPRRTETSSMTSLRFYLFCTPSVFRDNKEPKKELISLPSLFRRSRISTACVPGRRNY